MNNNLHNKTCYVFSQKTVDWVIQEWLEISIKNKPTKAEVFKITAAALPWFLKSFEQNSTIYMFTHNDLLDALENWKSTQISHYPNQKERIEETCIEIINFFESKSVIEHKMKIEA